VPEIAALKRLRHPKPLLTAKLLPTDLANSIEELLLTHDWE
jgi:hypothetical protein